MKTQHVILVCDRCQTERENADVAPHTIAIDGSAVGLDACRKCWDELRIGFTPLLGVSHPVKMPRAPKATRVRRASSPEPTDDHHGWTFTTHALIRLGERKIDALTAIGIAENPQLTRTSDEVPDAHVHERAGIGVVVVRERKLIITVFHRGDDADSTTRVAAAEFSAAG